MAVSGSSFDGKMLQWLGWFLLGWLISFVTLGICCPWAMCMMFRWETNHTTISGKRLKFTGTGGSLFGKWLLWMLLTIVTLGIFGLWIPVKIAKWKAEHTFF